MRDEQTSGAYDELHGVERVKVHGSDEEMRRGADYRFTTPKGGDFIPARLVMTTPASNGSVSSSARDPIRWYAWSHPLSEPGRIFNVERAPRFVEADELCGSTRNFTPFSVARIYETG